MPFFVVWKRKLLPKCPFLRPKKWHFEWPNQNSKTTFIIQTFPKYGLYDFNLVNLSLLGARSHLSSGSLWERFVSTSSPPPHLKSQRKSEDHLGCWASPGQQDNTGKLPCQVLEKKLRHILERNLETFRLFLLTSPWKPLRMLYSHFILVASPHKSEDEGRQPHQDFRTPPSHLWDIIANLQAVPIFRTKKKEEKTVF